MERFDERLQDLIIDSGLSLRKLAKISGVSAKQYSKYLHGTFPRVEVAAKIADYFKVSLDFLFGITEYEKNTKTNYDITLFVKRYEDLLYKNNMTHWKFCEKYSLSESSLRRWKAGDVPSINSLVIIAKNLSTSIDYLIGRDS